MGGSLNRKQEDSHIGIHIEIDRRGRLNRVYICGLSDHEVELARAALVRIVRPDCWSWLKRVLYRQM